MIVLERKKKDLPTMSQDELESEWREAKKLFDQALAQKTEADRVYVAAATQLNTLERLIKQVERREAAARREAEKSLLQTEVQPSVQAAVHTV